MLNKWDGSQNSWSPSDSSHHWGQTTFHDTSVVFILKLDRCIKENHESILVININTNLYIKMLSSRVMHELDNMLWINWLELRDTRWQNYHLVYENNQSNLQPHQNRKGNRKSKDAKLISKNVYCIFTTESYLKGTFDTLANKRRSSKKAAGLMTTIIC